MTLLIALIISFGGPQKKVCCTFVGISNYITTLFFQWADFLFENHMIVLSLCIEICCFFWQKISNHKLIMFF